MPRQMTKFCHVFPFFQTKSVNWSSGPETPHPVVAGQLRIQKNTQDPTTTVHQELNGINKTDGSTGTVNR